LCAGCIERSRELLGQELAALVGESYERAYQNMVRVQQLTELEETIDYSLSSILAHGASQTRNVPFFHLPSVLENCCISSLHQGE
jgi:hypothetical protein